MGDAGSLLIGFTLASLSIVIRYYEEGGTLYAVGIPVLILSVPLFDTCSVIFIRLRAGKSIFVGDTNHFSHRLVRLGMTKRETVLAIYLLGLILGGAATLLRTLDIGQGWIVFLLGGGVIVFVILLETALARRRLSKD